MSYTEKDITLLLKSNPDLAVMGDGTASATYEPVVKAVSGAAGVVKMSEFDMQTEVFRQCAIKAETNPDWQMVAACPNGQYRPGQRMEPGLARGFPDIMCLLPRIRGNVQRHGLFIELKVKDGKQSEFQLWWERRLRIQGYVVECIWDDPQKVISTLEWWIGGES